MRNKSKIIPLVCLAGLTAVLVAGCAKKQSYVEISPDIADSFPIQAEPAENPQLVESDGPYAILHTTAGDVTILLYPEQAPKAVENFIGLAKEGYYDGSLFYYAKREELTQGGKPGDPEAEERSLWGDPFEDEVDNGLYHFKGAVAMAGDGGNTRNSNLSQFYLLVREEKPEDDRIIPANCYMNDLMNMRLKELDELSQEKELSKEEIQKFEDDLNVEIQAIATDGIPSEYEAKYAPVGARYSQVGGAWGLDYGHTVFGQIVEGLNVAEAITQVKVSAEERKPKKDVVIESVEIIE
ncbi:peptidylprolyl isomerase [Lacrimispora sp.]|jgi:peptidyl-prolyl cis-trans isomerase B (cyclophilin B)|uniref:peptidylprolyl isomerase n=1 Tax=Lacrimispora sp. TaxID=2719234 RepID=UPI0026A70A1E|nr:peptidylprolyl isomerase [Lacrimispora sp.]